jgi:hypothetical protein
MTFALARHTENIPAPLSRDRGRLVVPSRSRSSEPDMSIISESSVCLMESPPLPPFRTLFILFVIWHSDEQSGWCFMFLPLPSLFIVAYVIFIFNTTIFCLSYLY